MDRRQVESILRRLKGGTMSVGEAVESLRSLPFEELGFATLDTHRAIRRGFPEAVYSQGKTDAQVAAIVERLSKHHRTVLATRVRPGTAKAVAALVGKANVHEFPEARMLVVGTMPKPRKGRIAILTAGTSDLPVAEEAAVTAESMGHGVDRVYDVGVAGVHRLLDKRKRLDRARVIVVVAGMEGALPSVVSGIVGVPVIAVPTSVGYGASFDGLAALLGMMNACSPGVAVVNIDNGFGAGYLAAMLDR
ncbi:MAG TPA: nickel pincer cofactor biosynthesis protein LarB [Thermoplasmata archaeon]|nr:nickel pincer cofactor biosynthesis protein LarB [Thermoplasmata archaeon]